MSTQLRFKYTQDIRERTTRRREALAARPSARAAAPVAPKPTPGTAKRDVDRHKQEYLCTREQNRRGNITICANDMQHVH